MNRPLYGVVGLLVLGAIGGLAFDGTPPRRVITRAGYRVLEADFHVHTRFSDGFLSPFDVVLHARRNGLDAFAITEHNLVYPAKMATWFSHVIGGPTVVVGEEVTTDRLHLIALGVEQRISPYGELGAIVDDVHRQGGLVIAAHPVKGTRSDGDAADCGTSRAYPGGMDRARELRERELRRARSATVWKMIAGASAALALSVVLVTSLRDRDAPPSSHEAQATNNASPPKAAVWTAHVWNRVDSAGAGVDEEAPSPALAPAATMAATSDATTTSATVDRGLDVAAGPQVSIQYLYFVWPPAVAVTAPPVEVPKDAGAIDDVATAGPADTASPRDTGTAKADAGPLNPWVPPSFSAGAGPFTTEAPYWAASAFVSNPNAGAGRFMTEAPPWAASAFTSDPNAGAGPFTTERNIPAFGVWPFSWWLMQPPPP